MAIFNHNVSNQNKVNRKGACFSVTMPYSVEKTLKEIQRTMGFNSRSQTIVYLVHQYDREQRTFESIDKLGAILDKMIKQNANAVPVQSELPYNNNN